jgi:hypothetical protein
LDIPTFCPLLGWFPEPKSQLSDILCLENAMILLPLLPLLQMVIWEVSIKKQGIG